MTDAAITDPHPEGNPALAAATEAIVRRRLAATHCNACEDAARARILLDALPDAAAAVEAAAPHLAAAERDRIRQVAANSPHRVEAGGEYCQEDGFRWPCRTARWLADLLEAAP